VRELANVVERLAILHAGTVVGRAEVIQVLPTVASDPFSGPAIHTAGGARETLPALPALPLSDALDAYERRLLSAALAQSDGNVAEAARLLQTDRPNLYRRMRRLGLAAAGE